MKRSGFYENRALTEREHQALEWAGRGLSMKGIALRLGISSGTVAWHLKNAYIKLGVSSREEALAKARASKLIETGAVCPVCAGALAALSSNAAIIDEAPTAR